MACDEFDDVAVKIGKVDGVGLPVGEEEFIGAAWFSEQGDSPGEPLFGFCKLLLRNIECEMIR